VGEEARGAGAGAEVAVGGRIVDGSALAAECLGYSGDEEGVISSVFVVS
jgi:hypothetical protein